MKIIKAVWPKNVRLKFMTDSETDERRIREKWAIEHYFKEGFCIKKKDIIVDIGAHIGTFTVYAAKLADRGRIFSFEPHPGNFQLLKKNCELNNIKNTQLFKYGVCGKRRKCRLFEDEKYTGRHSLYAKSKKAIVINCVSLREIFESCKIEFCNFLKIDCEGAEYDILFNTPKKDFGRIDKIAVEYHDFFFRRKKIYNLVNFLSKAGFAVKIRPISSYQGILYAKKPAKKALLVTLSDKNYVEQAKQLFSGVYWNSGWKGDYMLLAHNIPEKELKWFRKKGILIRKCKPLKKHRLSVRLDKFYLFTPEFKKWDNIVFLDADIIVRDSLDKLAEVRGFCAVPDAWDNQISDQAIKPIDGYNGTAFNSGVMAFSTDIIKRDTFSKLNSLLKEYGKISRGVDQLTFNLMFYKKWKKLPKIYNSYAEELINRYHIKPEKNKSTIIHFNESGNCMRKSREWIMNLKKAEMMDLKNKPASRKIFTEKEIRNHERNLALRGMIFFMPQQIDRSLGLFGIFLKKYFPRLYHFLKKCKGDY